MKNWIYLFILFFSVQVTHAQIRFTSEISSNKVALNQQFEISFNINLSSRDLSDAKLTLPELEKDFNILAGPIENKTISSRNGVTSYITGVKYILRPKKQGIFTINSAIIAIKDKKYITKEQKVEITKPIEEPSYQNQRRRRRRRHPAQSFFELMEKQEREQRKRMQQQIEEMRRLQQKQQNYGEGIFLVASVNKNSAFVNEPISIEYRLYVSHFSSINNLETKQMPKFKGFWNHIIEDKKLTVKEGKYNGKEYRYIVLRKGVLLPQKEGSISIEPMKLEIQTNVQTGKYDRLGRPEIINKKVPYASKKINLKVKPLPLKKQPESFNGAVGRFKYKVKNSELTNIKTNEVVEVSLTVSGSGNLELIELPEIESPQGLEVYEPQIIDKISNSLSKGMKGRRTYKYTIVPQYKGKYNIALPSFSYFDIKSKRYKTITPDTLKIDVTQGTELPKNDESKEIIAEVTKKNAFTNNYLNSDNSITESFYKNKTKWYTLIFLPILLIPLSLIFIFIKNQTAASESQIALRETKRLAKKYLSQAKKSLGKKEEFYEALERGLHHFLKATLKIETKDMSSEHILNLLEENKINDKSIETFMRLKENCEMARYAQLSKSNQEDDYNTAAQIFLAIQQEIKKSKK